MEPVSPVDDLSALIDELPPWMKFHGGFIITRLEKWIVENGGNTPWSEIRKMEKARVKEQPVA